jgi:alkylation response protein AidB-like acyl-CoA dehydrogenase
MSTVARTDWQTAPLPKDAQGWITRATEVAAVLATDAAARDKAAATPYEEVRLLKDSGLVTLLGPVEHGGGGQNWPTAYRVVREVATADGSIGQLLGYHYPWNWAARLVGTREQWEHVEAEAARNRWFFGGAVNPRDAEVIVRDEGDTLTFTGRKTFSTGSKVSDVTVLEGVLEGTVDHVFAIVPSDSEGLTFRDDWDNIGQRLTESGGVTLDAVRAPWSAAEDPLLVQRFGELAIRVRAAEALLREAARAVDTAGADLTDDSAATASVAVAIAKVAAAETAVELGSALFEVAGTRSALDSLGLHRHWRDTRTHSLHDPARWKVQHIGRYVLNGTRPPRHGLL